MTCFWFPHSDILGSTLGWQLPEAYRSLPRPSSALDAKASTMRPTTLTNTKTKVNHQNCTNKHAPPRGTHPSDARNHYPITKHHTPPPRRGDNTQTIRVLP